MSSNKSPANTRSDHAGSGKSSSKQGNEQQSEKQGSSQVDQAAKQGQLTGQAPKDAARGVNPDQAGNPDRIPLIRRVPPHRSMGLASGQSLRPSAGTP